MINLSSFQQRAVCTNISELIYFPSTNLHSSCLYRIYNSSHLSTKRGKTVRLVDENRKHDYFGSKPSAFFFCGTNVGKLRDVILHSLVQRLHSSQVTTYSQVNDCANSIFLTFKQRKSTIFQMQHTKPWVTYPNLHIARFLKELREARALKVVQKLEGTTAPPVV